MQEMTAMRVLIADDQPRVRRALRLLLEQAPGTCVVAEAAHARGLFVQAQASTADLVLLAWGLPGMATADLLPALRRVAPGLRVIVLSAQTDAGQDALDAGADAFVSKVDPPEYLLAAIERCRRG